MIRSALNLVSDYWRLASFVAGWIAAHPLTQLVMRAVRP